MRCLGFVVTLLVALPLAAQTEVGIIVVHTDTGATDLGGTSLSFRHSRGAGASVERFAGEHTSFELAAMWLRSDASLRTEGTTANAGTLKLVPITATARWHFAPRTERVDTYVGAGVAYVKASDLSSNDLDALGIGTIAVESKRCWLVNAGIAAGWFFVDGKYLDFRPESGPPDARVRLNLKPVVISLGLRFKL